MTTREKISVLMAQTTVSQYQINLDIQWTSPPYDGWPPPICMGQTVSIVIDGTTIAKANVGSHEDIDEIVYNELQAAITNGVIRLKDNA